MANKKQVGSVVVVLLASAAIIGGVAWYASWSARNQRRQQVAGSMYVGLPGMVNPFTGQHMSAKQVTEMEWL